MADPPRRVPAKALVLDFGSVVTKTMFETHRLTERQLGLREGALTWMGPFDPETDPLWSAMQRDELGERDYWQIRAREVGLLLGEVWTTMAQFVARARGQNVASIVRPEAVSTVERAKAAGRSVALLSNELDLFYGARIRDELALFKAFDVVIDGTYESVLKPDVAAYRACVAALRLMPDECVFVDDQLRNVVGAAAAGLRAIHLDVRRPKVGFDEALEQLGLHPLPNDQRGGEWS